MIQIEVKAFDELTTSELYNILQLRSDVFVVEQDCVYLDIDGKDQKALHVIGKKQNKIIAYTRIFKSGDYFKKASIGRVVVAGPEREHHYGYDIMNASIIALKKYFKETYIELSAQVYLKTFYSNLGFKTEGKEYLEDGIPHVRMIKEN